MKNLIQNKIQIVLLVGIIISGCTVADSRQAGEWRSNANIEQSASTLEEVGPLLSTKWGQRGEYAKYAPDNYRVGCWSTAFGQILYYHRLFPSEGRISYSCSKEDIDIREDIGKYDFNKRKPFFSTDDAARFLYTIAVIIQKDFGTGRYALNHQQRARMIDRYFNCTTELYKRLNGKALRKVLIAEIGQGRPVLIHLRNRKKKSYHAAVIDGYKTIHNVFIFHFNMGHKGSDDGWFRLDQPIAKYDDTTYHRIITVTPKQPHAQGSGQKAAFTCEPQL